MPSDRAVSASFQLCVQRLDDSLFLPRRQRGGPATPGNEHRLAQLEPANPKGAEPAAQRGQPGLEIGCPLGQIHAGQCLPGRLIGVEQPSFDIEDHDALAEAVEQGLGQGEKKD